MLVQEPYQIRLYCSAVNSLQYVYHSIVLPLRGDGVDIVRVTMLNILSC